MTSIHRNSYETIKGLICIHYQGETLYANEGLEIKLYEQKLNIGNTILGSESKFTIGKLVYVSFIPKILTNVVKLYNSKIFSVGNSMISNFKNDLLINLADDQVIELRNAIVVQMPSLYFYRDELRLGPVKFLGTLVNQPSSINMNKKHGILFDTLHGSFACQWGNEMPWNYFYPINGLDVHFRTFIKPIWTINDNSLLDFIFYGINVSIILKMEVIPELSKILDKINDIVIDFNYHHQNLRVEVKKMQFDDLIYKNFETQVTLKNNENTKTRNDDSVFNINFGDL